MLPEKPYCNNIFKRTAAAIGRGRILVAVPVRHHFAAKTQRTPVYRGLKLTLQGGLVGQTSTAAAAKNGFGKTSPGSVDRAEVDASAGQRRCYP